MAHNTGDKNPEAVARGLKAAIHNDRVSDEAKESAAQRLEEMGQEVPSDFTSGVTHSAHDDEGKDHDAQQRGYKSALSRSNVSAEAKEHARQMLDDEGTTASTRGRDKSPNRVLGGYKAALKNPNVSDEAKEHAEEVLREHDAL